MTKHLTIARLLTFWLALVFAVCPLAYTAKVYLVFDLPKLLILQTGIEIAFVIWLLAKLPDILRRSSQAINQRSRDNGILTPRSVDWNIAFLLVLFLVINALAVLFAHSPFQAWWGNYYRRQGFFVLLHYIALFLMLRDLARDKVNIKIILTGLLLGAVGTAAFALSELFDLPSYNSWKGFGAYENRLISSFGQPNLTAAYLGMILPVLVWPLVKTNKIWLKILSGIIAIILVAVIIGTGSRAGWLALFLTIIIACSFALYHSQLAKKQKVKIAAGVFVFLIIIGSLGLLSLARSHGSEWRLGEFVHPETWYKTERFQIWDRVLDLVSQKPLLGYGHDNLELVFSASLRPQDTHLQTIYVDRAHNLFLENMINTGLLGTIAWLALWFTIVKQASSPSPTNPPNIRSLNLLLICGLGYYLLQGIANVSNVLIDAMPWLFLAILASPTQSSPTRSDVSPIAQEKPATPPFLLYASALIAGGLAALVIWFNASIYFADASYKQGLSWDLVDKKTAIQHYTEAINRYPPATIYRLRYADDTLAIASTAPSQSERQEWLQKANSVLHAGDKFGNKHADFNYRLGQIYQQGQTLVSEDWQAQATYYLDLAHQQAPFKY